jgi:glycerol-3-phosphate dehydrogenase (NAD(P)+)
MVAASFNTAPAILELTRDGGVAMPICEQVNEVLFRGRRPEDAVDELMTRDPVTELHDLT